MLQHLLNTVQDLVALGPGDPTPTPTGGAPIDPTAIINTAGIVSFFVRGVVPLLLCASGMYVMGRAHRGRISEVATTSGISLWGLALIAAGPLLFFMGDKLVQMAIG